MPLTFQPLDITEIQLIAQPVAPATVEFLTTSYLLIIRTSILHCISQRLLLEFVFLSL